MPVRRAADPISVQHVWDAIRFALSSHIICNLQTIVKYLQKVENCSITQAELHVRQCMQDGFLVSVQKLGNKGSKIGVPSEVYKIPFEELQNLQRSDKDWYCIECHLAGDVTPCRQCHRVFHSECAIIARKKFNDFHSFSKINSYNRKVENRLSTFDTSTTSSSSMASLSDINLNNTGTETGRQNSEDAEKSNENTSNLDALFESFEKIEGSLDSLDSLVGSAMEDKENKKDSTNSVQEKDAKSPLSSGNENIYHRHGSKENYIYDESLCRVCNLFEADDDVPLDKKELNYLLTFVHQRIKSWVPACLTDKMAPDEKLEWLTEDELNWRTLVLLYEKMDMNMIKDKLESESYNQICEFLADVITVQHNIAVFHGIESQEYGAAEFMYEDCNYDLSELRTCVDCYRHSNEKINSKWFCLPCRVPHKLVWAKQKGYPYWPAKVIKETNDKCDVRYFGGNHERSLLQKVFIKPISTPMQSLQIKRNAAFNKSVEELLLHQMLIENPSEVQNLISKKVKKRSLSKFKEKKTPPAVSKSKPHTPGKVENLSASSDDDLFSFNELCEEFENSFATKGNETSQRTPKRKHSQSLTRGSTESVQNAKRKPLSSNSTPKSVTNRTGKRSANDVINLTSDADEELPFKEDDQFSPGYGEVSSSTEHIKLSDEGAKDVGESVMQQLDRQYSEAVERTKQKLEKCKDKKQLIKVALDSMQAEIDRINNDHDEYLKKIFEAHNLEISQTKKKQWCYNCEQDAIYHCCWNTAYCSPTCQQQHWQAEHKKVCRRKR